MSSDRQMLELFLTTTSAVSSASRSVPFISERMPSINMLLKPWDGNRHILPSHLCSNCNIDRGNGKVQSLPSTMTVASSTFFVLIQLMNEWSLTGNISTTLTSCSRCKCESVRASIPVVTGMPTFSITKTLRKIIFLAAGTMIGVENSNCYVVKTIIHPIIMFVPTLLMKVHCCC